MAQKNKSNTANGFAQVSKTTITVLQNSNGVKRTIKETTSAPKKRPAVKKPTSTKPVKKVSK